MLSMFTHLEFSYGFQKASLLTSPSYHSSNPHTSSHPLSYLLFLFHALHHHFWNFKLSQEDISSSVHTQQVYEDH